MVVPEPVLVQIGLKVLRRYCMVDAINPALDQRPKALNGVGVNEATGVSLGRMLNRLMGIAELLDKVVAPEFVGVDRGVDVSWHLLPQNRQQSPSLDVGYNLGSHRATALNDPDHGSLAVQAPASLTALLASKVGLVNLHATEHGFVALGHNRPDLVEHAPSRLVGHSNLSLELLGRYAAAGRSDQEEGMEPTPQRRRAVVEDGVRRGADLGTTELTAIGLPSLDPVVLRDLLALRTEDTLGPTGLHQKVKAGVVVRELIVKLLQRVDLALHGTPSLSKKEYSTKCTCCQGIVTFREGEIKGKADGER